MLAGASGVNRKGLSVPLGRPKALMRPLGGQRPRGAWGPLMSVPPGRPKALTRPLGGQRPQEAWGPFMSVPPGRPKALTPPRGAATAGSVGGVQFSPD